jgi:hypothetical protein
MTVDVIEQDYEMFLGEHRHAGPIAASIPTAIEVGLEPLTEWATFATKAVADIVDAAGPHPTILVQTDRLVGGQTMSWPGIIASAVPAKPITWHKIALRRPVDTIDIHRPTYRHVICLGGRPGRRTPDVWTDGPVLWAHGTGIETARRIADYVADYVATHDDAVALNPFCGVGTILAAFQTAGLSAIGCDNNPDRIFDTRWLLQAEVPA